MAQIDTQALKERLAKWRGFKKFGWKNWDLWLRPNEKPPEKLSIGGLFANSHALPNFPEDLSACFKWLVPKLQDKGITVDLYGFEHRGFAVNLVSIFPIDDTGSCPTLGDSKDDNPALALCLAIEKLIDGEK